MSLWSVDPKACEEFLHAYVCCALWCTNDDFDTPLEVYYDRSDLAPETAKHIEEDCNVFIRNNRFLLMGIEPEQAGHDFWLTRNGHGAGFWDRGLDEIGDALTVAAHAFGNVDLYVGDDGLLYLA